MVNRTLTSNIYLYSIVYGYNFVLKAFNKCTESLRSSYGHIRNKRKKMIAKKEYSKQVKRTR